MEAYETKSLRGKALLRAKRLIELRRQGGKRTMMGRPRRGRADAVGASSAEPVSGGAESRQVVRAYHQELHRQRVLVSKAKVCETRLLFVTTALASAGSEPMLQMIVLPMLLHEP